MDLKVILKEILAAHQIWLDTEGREGTQANLKDADLEGASLSVADLMRANLRRANLRNADFWMADMKDTVLQGTDLQGANLSDVTNLTQNQINSAITNEKTVLPAGLKRS
jgi:uncharacterized protein YjbI with pentapeptide repeats